MASRSFSLPICISSLFTPLEEIKRAVHLTNRLRPDLVVLTGDYVSFSRDYIGPLAQALGKLRARLGVFAVLGNHDFQVDPEEVTRALRSENIRVLRNSHHALRAGPAVFGSPVWMIYGGRQTIWMRQCAAVPRATPGSCCATTPWGSMRPRARESTWCSPAYPWRRGASAGGGGVVWPVEARQALHRRLESPEQHADLHQPRDRQGTGSSARGCPAEITCLRLRKT